MTTWLIFACLAGAALAALVWPLLRPGETENGGSEPDKAIYKDQLRELERDEKAGLIGKAEAEAARNEISRRLIAAGAAPAVPLAQMRRPHGALFAALLVPGIALPLYLREGSPGLGDVPQARRLATAEERQDGEALVYKVEKAVERNPEDVRGWEILSGVYRDSGRFGDAARAYANLLRIETPTADRLAAFGEMLVFANGGKVSKEADESFRRALALDAKMPKARFFAAVALKQAGKAAEARTAFEALLADAPADAPWRATVLAQLDKGPSQEDVAAAQDMSAEDRTAMIRTMVDGLEARLAQDGDDTEGWLKLIRSRAVLGEMDKAKAAYDAALAALKDRPDDVSRIAALAKELGVIQ